ncbi:MAG TPA: hypothetical protein VFT22_38850 [Kofleriaceae bacterium]|nr:hypothetical protein [Kofleriaceae bacterium]
MPDIFKGVLTAKIDWSSTGLGPKDLLSSSKLSEWSVLSPDKNLTTRLELSGGDLQKIVAMITQSIAARSDPASHQGEHAELVVALTSECDAKGSNRVYVTVTNRGPHPAYKVVAQLKSSSKVVHGVQLTADLIEPGKTLRLPKRLPPLDPGSEQDPMVHAVVTARNAPSVTTSSRLHLVVPKSAPPLQLSCATVEKSGEPGQKLRIHCTATNPSDVTTRITSIDVAVGQDSALPATQPADSPAVPDLTAHGTISFEVTPTLPRDAKPGSSVPLTIKLSSEDFTPVQQEITVRVFEAGMCTQTRLSREQYDAKRKRLQALLDSGALTQGDFDRYDDENVACLE